MVDVVYLHVTELFKVKKKKKIKLSLVLHGEKNSINRSNLQITSNIRR